MTNIPTELLRTLLAVVDLRSFTKAARVLGVTQPAVSAQIKRLQSLLGFELFDKSAPGVSLTEKCERLVRDSRRMLAINDQIVALAQCPTGARVLRFGLPGDFIGAPLWQRLARFRERWPEVGLHMKTGGGHALLGELNQGDLDVAVALSGAKPQPAAVHYWRDELIWIRSASAPVAPDERVRLLTRPEPCTFRRRMIATLEAAARPYEIAVTAADVDDLARAVAAGLGVTALPRGVALPPGASPCEAGALPNLPEVMVSVCVGADPDSSAREELAALIADALKPPQQAQPAPRLAKPETLDAASARASVA